MIFVKNGFNMIIIAGSGPGFGTGHVTRMSELHQGSAAAGARAEFLVLEGSSPASEELRVRPHDSASGPGRLLDDWISAYQARIASLPGSDTRPVIVLDARDLDPTIFPGPVLALDNRCPHREEILPDRIFFHDTIPHPDAALDEVLRNCLISDDLVRARANLVGTPTKSGGRRALVYVGDTGMEARLDPILTNLLARGDLSEVLRVGGTPPEGMGAEASVFRYAGRLDGAEYARALAAGDIVYAYFGMTILEAWYLGKAPVLYSIDSAVHQELSRNLSERTGIPYLDSTRPEQWQGLVNDDAADGAGGTGRPSVAGPGGRGFEILRELVAAAGRRGKPA